MGPFHLQLNLSFQLAVPGIVEPSTFCMQIEKSIGCLCNLLCQNIALDWTLTAYSEAYWFLLENSYQDLVSSVITDEENRTSIGFIQEHVHYSSTTASRWCVGMGNLKLSPIALLILERSGGRRSSMATFCEPTVQEQWVHDPCFKESRISRSFFRFVNLPLQWEQLGKQIPLRFC